MGINGYKQWVVTVVPKGHWDGNGEGDGLGSDGNGWSGDVGLIDRSGEGYGNGHGIGGNGRSGFK